MNLHSIDWVIVTVLLAALSLAGYICNKYSKGVADFLVAGRSVGRYLGVGSDAMSGLAAVTILALWQMCYQSGLAGSWWFLMKLPFAILLALTGWGIYRFRQTKAMTIPQYLEMRYSKKFRVFAGMLTYIAGILNMGIFPIIGAGFFVYFCGLPQEMMLFGHPIPTVFFVMVILQGAAVAMCFMGGQVTLIVTDFIQGIFVSVMFIVIAFVINRMFSWDQVVAAYSSASNAQGLLHPFKNPESTNFTVTFFMIDAFWLFYNIISWSPGTMQIGSAKDAHEAKMMRVMGMIRQIALLGLGLFLLPYAAFVLMHHPDFASLAEKANLTINSITNPQVRSQMIVPAAVAQILPVGLMGAFTAVVMFAFIACHDTYLLAWGGILVQDIIVPLRGKPVSPKTHIWLLRGSILASATFTVLWSMFFKQVDDIFMYFDITASVYLSGAGVVILGGIYWRRGTTIAAWVAMITGSLLSITGFVLKSQIPDQVPNGRMMAFYAVCISVVTYVLVSLFTKDPNFDLNKMLHRNPDQEYARVKQKGLKWWKFGNEYSKGDKIFCTVVVLGIIIYFLLFIGTALYHYFVKETTTQQWINFWYWYFRLMFMFGTIFLVWITVGGIKDLIKMFRQLKSAAIDNTDDGRVK